jgi:hypothetical protein
VQRAFVQLNILSIRLLVATPLLFYLANSFIATMSKHRLFWACALLTMAGTTKAVDSDEANSRRSSTLKGQTHPTDTTKEAARNLKEGGGYGYYPQAPMYDYGQEYAEQMEYAEPPKLPYQYPPPPPEYYYRSKAMMKKSKKSAYGYPYYKSKAMMGGSGYGGYYEGYYPMEEMYEYGYVPPTYDEGDEFLKLYGGPCVHVIETIHFEMPPNTDIFEPNGSVFGEVGTMHVWALTTVEGYGTLDGKCIRTWPDFDGLGGDAVCEFVLTDPETGDQLTFGGKLDSIMPGGRMAVTGGSGSVSGVFGDMIVHAVLEGGKDVLDKAKYYEVEGKLGIIHCPGWRLFYFISSCLYILDVFKLDPWSWTQESLAKNYSKRRLCDYIGLDIRNQTC